MSSTSVTGFGADVGAALVAHPIVAKIAFTGSDLSGQKIYEAAARDIKHVTLELGGKSPNIVFDDADLEAAVKGAISGIFAATGQTCIAGSRLLLQRSIHDTFVERLIEVAKSARIGDPMLPDTHVGPITTEPQYRKVLDYIAIAKQEGAARRRTSMKYDGRAYAQDPDIRWRIADAVLAQDGAELQVFALARDVDEQVDHGARWFAQLVGLKVRATESARVVVDNAIRVSGGGSYFSGSELGRLYRDVLAGLFHPSDDESAHATVATSVLGPPEA